MIAGRALSSSWRAAVWYAIAKHSIIIRIIISHSCCRSSPTAQNKSQTEFFSFFGKKQALQPALVLMTNIEAWRPSGGLFRAPLITSFSDDRLEGDNSHNSCVKLSDLQGLYWTRCCIPAFRWNQLPGVAATGRWPDRSEGRSHPVTHTYSTSTFITE